MKKIGYLALVGCLGLAVTGCKAETEDFSKQVDKLSEVVEKGKIFDNDYQIKGVMKVKYDSETMDVKYHLERDQDNYWVKMEGKKGDDEAKIQTWLGEKDGKYYTFYEVDSSDDEDDVKTYTVIDSDDVSDSINDLLDDIEYINASLEETYKNLEASLDSMVETCENNKNDDLLTCSVEKSLFGTVTLTIKAESFGQSVETSYSLRGGKLRKVTFKMGSDDYELEISAEYSYFNQIVRLPSTDDFTKEGE